MPQCDHRSAELALPKTAPLASSQTLMSARPNGVGRFSCHQNYVTPWSERFYVNNNTKWPQWPWGPKWAKIGATLSETMPSPLVVPAHQVESTFNDKWRANGTRWTMGDPIWGIPWAIWGRFAHSKPHFGLMCAKTVIWPYLGLRGSNCNSEGTFPRYNMPQNGPNTPLDPSFGACLSI